MPGRLFRTFITASFSKLFYLIFLWGPRVFFLLRVCGEVGFWATVPGKLAKKDVPTKNTDTQCMVLFTYIYPLNYPNAGKYTMHLSVWDRVPSLFCVLFFRSRPQDLQVIGLLATSHEVSRGAVIRDTVPWFVFGGSQEAKTPLCLGVLRKK